MNLAEEFVECFPPYAKCTVVSTSNVLILKRDTCSEDWFVLELLLLIRAWHSGLFSRLRRLGSKLNLTAAKMDATRALLDELMQEHSAAVKAACEQRCGALRLLLAEQIKELRQAEQQRVAAQELAAAKVGGHQSACMCGPACMCAAPPLALSHRGLGTS